MLEMSMFDNSKVNAMSVSTIFVAPNGQLRSVSRFDGIARF